MTPLASQFSSTVGESPSKTPGVAAQGHHLISSKSSQSLINELRRLSGFAQQRPVATFDLPTSHIGPRVLPPSIHVLAAFDKCCRRMSPCFRCPRFGIFWREIRVVEQFCAIYIDLGQTGLRIWPPPGWELSTKASEKFAPSWHEIRRQHDHAGNAA